MGVSYFFSTSETAPNPGHWDQLDPSPISTPGWELVTSQVVSFCSHSHCSPRAVAERTQASLCSSQQWSSLIKGSLVSRGLVSAVLLITIVRSQKPHQGVECTPSVLYFILLSILKNWRLSSERSLVAVRHAAVVMSLLSSPVRMQTGCVCPCCHHFSHVHCWCHRYPSHRSTL